MSEVPKSESDKPGGGAGAAPPQHSARQGAARAGGPALEAMYQLLLWLIPTLEKLPRSQKFLLGDRLQVEAQGVLDSLICATYTRERGAHLRAANLGLEKMRFGIRLAKDLRHLDFKAYEHAARRIDDVGRLVGGWLRSDRAGPGRAVSSADAADVTQA